MKLWAFALAVASVGLRGQDLPGNLWQKPDPQSTQAPHQNLFNWQSSTPPNGVWKFETDPNQPKFFTYAWPNGSLPVQSQPRIPTCVAPLLSAPVSPKTQFKMPVLDPPKSKTESAEIVKVPPPCWSGRLK